MGLKRGKAKALLAAALLAAAASLACLGGCSGGGYTPPTPTPTLASPTIGQDGVLRVGVNSDTAPLAGKPSGSDRVIGIDVDMAAALADRFGLKLEIIDVGSDLESALAGGTVDIVMGVDRSDSHSFWVSDSYLPTAVALFGLASETEVPASDAAIKVAAQASSKSAWAVTNEFANAELTSTDDLRSALDDLQMGAVQYAAADAIIGTYAIHSAGMDAHIVALMQQPGGYGVGVSDGNAELKQAVSDAVVALNGNGVGGVIQSKWLGSALDFTNVPLTALAASSIPTDTQGDEGSGDEGSSEEGSGEEGSGDEGGTEGDASGDEGAQGEGGTEAAQPNTVVYNGVEYVDADMDGYPDEWGDSTVPPDQAQAQADQTQA